MTPSAEIYFGFKNQYNIVLNTLKQIFFIVYDANKNTKIETIVLYFVIKKILK